MNIVCCSMGISRWSLDEVVSWGRRWSGMGRNDDFFRPHANIWPRDTSDIPGLVDAIRSCLPIEDQRRFNQVVLASLLLSPSRNELVSLLRGRITPDASGFPCTLDQLLEIDWIRVPTLLADDQRGEMRFVLLGSGRVGHGSWVTRMDQTAADAVKLALDLAGLPDALVWPMVDPDILSPALHGTSLGLPVALGAWLLRQGRDWPDGLVCTGGLAKDGGVTPVDNVPVKAGSAVRLGFRVLLHPVSGFESGSSTWPEQLTGVGVQTLDEAQSLAACFDPAHVPEMAVLYRRRWDPVRFLDAATAVPSAFLNYLASTDHGFREQLTKACLRPENAIPLLGRLLGRMADHSLPLAEISGLLRMFFPFDIWRTQALETPEIGVRVARLHLEAANHQGVIHESTRWEPVLRQSCVQLLAHRDNRSEELLAALHVLVNNLHNRYTFTVAKLKERIRPWDGVIHALRKEWQARCQRCPDACCDELGRYHGTLAQHFGFCGPEHMEEVEHHVRQAQEAFGNGRIPDKRADWRRGFSCLFHARLDAGLHDALRHTLESYLDQPLETVAFDPMDKYEHYHLAKFLALADGNVQEHLKSRYLEWALVKLPDAPSDHPWQLWALNLGKATTNPEDRARFLRASLHRCRTAPGPTIRAMTLMPLAWLVQDGLMDREQAAQETEAVVAEIQANGLDQEHFAALFGMSGVDILREVLESEERLFPFGYR